MKKNFSKALAGTLTVAMVLGMAAPAAGTTAQAYAKNGIKTKYSAIYAGTTKTYTLETTEKNVKWSVRGAGKQFVTLSKKKGKSVKVTIAKEPTAAGLKATVVAKIKKGKGKKAKYKQVDADKFTIKVDATAVAVQGNDEVKTGSTAIYTATTKPVETTNHVYFTVTDKNGNATTGATMTTTATSGVLKANAPGEYKVNVATARGDKKAGEGKFTANASMDVKVTDPVAPEAKLTSAKQTEAKKVVVTFDSEVKELKNEDITIVNDSDKSSKTLKSVSIGEDKKTATIEVLVDILDGKSYTVTYKGSTAQFTASDGTVADFSLNNTEFQVKKKQELKVNVLDKNQVVIKTIDVKDPSTTDGKYTINVTSNDGYFTDDKLVMQTIGKSEEVVATYHSQKYNSTTGAEEGNIEKKFTITAVAQADLAAKYEYATISDAAPDEWAETTCSLQLPISNDKKDSMLFAKILDVKGIETINGAPYNTDLNITCTSSDDTILLVDATDDGVELTGVKAGTAYVQVKQNGVTKLNIPVTVTAARTLTNAVMDNSNITLSNATAVAEDATIKLGTHKDQYNKETNNYEISKVEVKNASNDNIKAWAKTYEGVSGVTEFKIAPTSGSSLVRTSAGSFKFELTFKDKDTDKELKRTVSVTVKQPDYSKSATIKAKADDSKDVAMKKKDDVKLNENEFVDFKLGVYFNGVLGAYLDLEDSNIVKSIEFTKNGNKEKDKEVTDKLLAKATQGAMEVGKFTRDGNAVKLAYHVATSDSGIRYVDKLGAANYAFKITTHKNLSINVAGVTKKINEDEKTYTKTLTVKDTQPTLKVTQVKNNVDANSAEDAIYKACTFVYDGKTYKKADEGAKRGIAYVCGKTKDGNTATKDIQYYLNGKVYSIVKMNVFVSMPDDAGAVDADDKDFVKFEVKPNFSITVND